MRELWLVARYEFRRVIRQRSFLFFTFGMPLLMLISISAPILVSKMRATPTIGYIDQSGLLSPTILPPDDDLSVKLRRFEQEAAAKRALWFGEIETLWIIPPNYLTTGRLRHLIGQEIGFRDEQAIGKLLSMNLLQEVPEQIASRVQEPAQFRHRALERGDSIEQEGQLFFALGIPFALAMAFSFSITFSSGFLVSAVAEEKANRLLEILVTSTRIWSLIGGKVLGLGAVAFMQLLVWGLMAVAVLLSVLMGGSFPNSWPIPWVILAWITPFFLLSYTLYAAILVGIGLFMGTPREAQQVASFLGLMAFTPIFFISILMNNPDGITAHFLTLFPFTSAIVIPMRMALGEVALWERLVSLTILFGTVMGAIYIVSMIFRHNMLHYGSNSLMMWWRKRGQT